MICYLDYIGNLIKASVSHTESLAFLNLRLALERRTQKGKKKLPFLPRQQRPFLAIAILLVFSG